MHIETLPESLDTPGALRRFIQNLYFGWGYRAYDQDTQQRADDRLLRNGICELLSALHRYLDDRKIAYRSVHLPPPSRAHPFPDPEAVKRVEHIERLQRDVGDLEVAVRNAALPDGDRVWQSHRNLSDLLVQLRELDECLGEQIVTEIQQFRARVGAQSDPLNWSADWQPTYAVLARRREILSALR